MNYRQAPAYNNQLQSNNLQTSTCSVFLTVTNTSLKTGDPFEIKNTQIMVAKAK
jgi:hypothetical protein